MAVLERTIARIAPDTKNSFRPRRWNVAEYYRMAEVGILGPDERTELIEGEIFVMEPIGAPHATIASILVYELRKVFGEGNHVNAQAPIHLADASEPQPDVYVARGSARSYMDHHPQPDELLLVVEVSDSSLSSDQKIKAILYADAGIREYWIVNLIDRRLEVYRDPAINLGYRTTAIYVAGDVVTPLNAEASQIAVAGLLP